MRRFVLVFVLSILPAAAHAQGTAVLQKSIAVKAPLVAHAARLQGAAPAIDGAIDEAAWQSATPVSDFVQIQPSPGKPASQRTEARVLYDTDAVYVAMRLWDSAPDSIGTQMTRRDQNGNADWAHVAFDSYFDKRTAFHFALSPRGGKMDIFRFNDTSEDSDWDAVWEGAARVDSLGWTAEFRIPLSQLRFDAPAAGQPVVWGVNFARTIARYREDALWAPVAPDANGMVSLFGELHGLEGLSAKRRLEVQPYSLARLAREPGEAGDPFHESNDLGGSFGADLKYGVTSNLTLTATINPDFGQVEADPSQVNLSAYETFFPERRPFFVEGADIFRFGTGAGDGDFGNEQLFYSRRIGRSPQGGADGDFVDVPGSTTILGAAKLSGKTSNGWSIGVLDAVTGAEDARIFENGLERSTPVEPLTNYAVARVIRDFRDGKSAVGAIATATHRRTDAPELDFLRDDAYAGGMDLRHRFGGGNYEMKAWVLGSHVRGSTDAITRTQRSSSRYFQRPDADHLELDTARTSLTGMAASIEAGKFGGGHWRGGGILNLRTPEFEVNDLGFMQNADQMLQVLWGGYQQYEPGDRFRRWRVNANQWSGWTFGGEKLSLGGNVNGGFQLLNFWGANMGVNRELASLMPGALRGGPALRRPGSTNFWFSGYTDGRKSVQAELSAGGWWQDETDGTSFWLEPELSMRPSDRLQVSLSTGLRRGTETAQYVTRRTVADETHYVFARLEQNTASMTARVSYSFSPLLSLQLYAQPFVSAGRYGRFMEVEAPKAAVFDDRFHAYGENELSSYRDGGDLRWRIRSDAVGGNPYSFTFADPNFNVKEIRTNAVLRWEYRPGSNLYVVWSRGQSDQEREIGSFRPARDFGRLFGAPSSDVFLLKASYWLDI